MVMTYEKNPEFKRNNAETVNKTTETLNLFRTYNLGNFARIH